MRAFPWSQVAVALVAVFVSGVAFSAAFGTTVHSVGLALPRWTPPASPAAPSACWSAESFKQGDRIDGAHLESFRLAVRSAGVDDIDSVLPRNAGQVASCSVFVATSSADLPDSIPPGSQTLMHPCVGLDERLRSGTLAQCRFSVGSCLVGPAVDGAAAPGLWVVGAQNSPLRDMVLTRNPQRARQQIASSAGELLAARFADPFLYSGQRTDLQAVVFVSSVAPVRAYVGRVFGRVASKAAVWPDDETDAPYDPCAFMTGQPDCIDNEAIITLEELFAAQAETVRAQVLQVLSEALTVADSPLETAPPRCFSLYVATLAVADEIRRPTIVGWDAITSWQDDLIYERAASDALTALGVVPPADKDASETYRRRMETHLSQFCHAQSCTDAQALTLHRVAMEAKFAGGFVPILAGGSGVDPDAVLVSKWMEVMG